jgi:hypothetical protein
VACRAGAADTARPLAIGGALGGTGGAALYTLARSWLGGGLVLPSECRSLAQSICELEVYATSEVVRELSLRSPGSFFVGIGVGVLFALVCFGGVRLGSTFASGRTAARQLPSAEREDVPSYSCRDRGDGRLRN